MVFFELHLFSKGFDCLDSNCGPLVSGAGDLKPALPEFSKIVSDCGSSSSFWARYHVKRALAFLKPASVFPFATLGFEPVNTGLSGSLFQVDWSDSKFFPVPCEVHRRRNHLREWHQDHKGELYRSGRGFAVLRDSAVIPVRWVFEPSQVCHSKVISSGSESLLVSTTDRGSRFPAVCVGAIVPEYPNCSLQTFPLWSLPTFIVGCPSRVPGVSWF